jgi:hypothetical protein
VKDGQETKRSQKGKYRCLSKSKKYRTTDKNFVECTYKRSLNIEVVDQVVWDTVLNVLEDSHLYKENFKNSTLAIKEDSSKREARLKINQKEEKQDKETDYTD